MKLNGVSNIITDRDITLTGEQTIGKSLSTVLEERGEKLNILEENVKFLYEHGGVGGGSGSGGSGTTKWKLKATLGNMECTSGVTIGLANGIGSYTLRIWTSGGSGTYSVTYSYGNKVPTIVTLNAGNAWSANIKVDLTTNGSLSISATDGSITKQINGVSYIVEPYRFNAPMVMSQTGLPYPADIFVEDAQNTGVILKSLKYAYTVNGIYTYEWYYDNELLPNGTGTLIDSSGDISCDITSLMTNENAATHFYKLKIYAQLESDLEPTVIEYTGSFNLIPTTLFLKLSPPEGTIFYDNSSTLDPYAFGINKIISLQARIYKGRNATNESGDLYWYTYENGQLMSTNYLGVKDGRTYNINVSFGSVGWNYVEFVYSLTGESGKTITKYFYCDSIETNYNWYIDWHFPNERRYYIAQEIVSGSLTKLNGINWSGLNPSNPPLYIEKLSSDTSATELTIDSFSTGEQMINIGIQYNDINNSKNELIKLYDTVNKSKDTIKIYQNKIVFGNDIFDSNNECEIFLHKEQNYNLNERSKYHLLTICMAHTGAVDFNNNPYYEISVYFDGVLEGIVPLKSIATRPIYKVDLMPGNYAINQFEIASWTLNTYTRLLNDIDINWYWNSYKSRTDRDYSITTEDSLILSSLFDSNNANVPTYRLENQLIRVQNGFAETVANNVSVPVLVLKCPKTIAWGEGQESSIFEWINTKYTDGQGGLLQVEVTTELQYSSGKSSLSNVIIPETLGNNNHFTIKIQGSSTVNNKAKNFTLRLNSGSDITDAGEAILFSPNYNMNDPDTFLPEQAFTLKADVVDSSHTNNTAMGKFVNENNNWSYGGRIVADPEIRDHVKQCLEGYATLVFLNVVYRDDFGIDNSDFYYLGIYNFNLGRDSHFNLGYCDLSQLSAATLNDQSGVFKFCKVGGSIGSGINPMPGFIAAEVQDNSSYWDFSQYDQSILFPINNTETGNFMFGDIVNSAGEDNIVQNRIQNFVKSVTAAGGYIFETIGKSFEDCASQNGDVGKYNIPNTVSDYKIQHKRMYNGTNLEWPTIAPSFTEVTEGSLRNCIIDNQDEDIYSKLNYDSAVYYYTTCMVFGLVDSVEKNLNIKTWNATDPNKCQMGLYFYDMDTCLGKDNAGGKVSYFAFSDFWKSNIERYDANGDLIPDNDTITEVDRIVNKGCDIHRDCFLKNYGVTGYDIPSSYLFAIPKYAKAILSNFDTTRYPQQVYAEWRQPGGILENADKFIDTYYASNFNGIPECLINLNYRNKYLYDYDRYIDDKGLPVNNLEKASVFHGRGVEYTRDWLSGRLHILDAYFNLGNSSIEIVGGIPEPLHNVSVQNNPDIYILSDIFTNAVNGSVQRKEPFSFVVSADDYSPLFVKLGNGYRWYLFEDSNVKYETYVDVTGSAQVTTFGGSQLWRTLDDINGFVSTMNHPEDSFILNSNTIDSIVGTVGTHTGGWLINAPSVKNIVLTSANYSGALSISNQFPSLSSVDISNSSISLIINEDQITTGGIISINASNLKNANQLIIENCNRLTECNLEGSKIGTCIIRPAWTDVLDFSNIYARTLRLSTRNNGTLTINDNDTVADLQFSNMETVTIDQCPSLTSVKCVDSTNFTPLKSLTVNNCTSLTTLEIIADERLEVINLFNCSALNQIKITSSSTEFPNLRILNFGNTAIGQITYVLNGNTVVQSNGVFDFSTIFPNVATVDNANNYVRFYGNKAVKTIQFNNDINKPTILRYSFNGCTSLQRIYGTFKVKAVNSAPQYLFNDCSNFSIHGTNLNSAKWAGNNILDTDGRIKHPTELNDNADTYCQSGTKCTNIIFDSGVTTLGTGTEGGAFRNTKCTIFDLYYILYRLTPNIKTLSGCFYSITASTYTRFNWTDAVDNSPHRLTFVKCENVTNANYLCSGSSTYTIRLFSPTTDANGNIVANDGVLSPLIKLSSFAGLFYQYDLIADRFLFRRNDTNFAATTISRFRTVRIVDDVNTIPYFSNADTFQHYADYILSNNESITEKYGNLTGFFDNLDKLSTMYGILNASYINFSTITIPDSVTKIIQCFRSSYGTGEINLSNYFSNNTRLTTLGHSFRTSYSYNNDVPFMILSNDTFERFVPRPESSYNGLIYIANADGVIGSTSYLQDDKTDNCFSGVIRKYVTNPFPYRIFSILPNLQRAEGVFQNAEGNINNLQLPGNLFEDNTKLTSCRACFFNIKIPYTISPTHEISYERSIVNDKETAILNITESNSTFWNFINCPDIKDVSYLFGGSVYLWRNNGDEKEQDELPSLTGFIPKNLFWHGLKTLEIKNFIGANERIQNLDEHDNPIPNSYTYTQLEDSIILVEPKADITNISYCFYRSNLDAYVNEHPYIEDNPNYNPYVWNYDSSKDRYVENSYRNTDKQTIIWYFDGNHSHKPNNLENVEQLDKVDGVVINPSEQMENDDNRYRIRSAEWSYDNDTPPTAIWNYIAPPDLLRYCDPKCNVTYLFSRSGLRGTSSHWSVGETRNKYLYGLKGRLCPYMLKPVSDIESVAYMFYACKCISYISDDLRERDYWIPEDFFSYTKKVTNLTACFAYTIQPNRSVLEFVFDKLGDPINVVNSNALTIDSIFYFVYWSGSSTNRTILQNIFIHNRIASLTSCFRVRSDVEVSTEQSPSLQYVTFKNIFPTSGVRYNTSTYDNKTGFKYAFYGFYRNSVIFETPLTLRNSTNNNNYLTTNYGTLNE